MTQLKGEGGIGFTLSEDGKMVEISRRLDDAPPILIVVKVADWRRATATFNLWLRTRPMLPAKELVQSFKQAREKK